MKSSNPKPHIPIYHSPPNKLLWYEFRYFHDGSGNGGIERIAIFLDKKKNRCETTAQINWNPDYKKIWNDTRKRLQSNGYLLHNTVREPMCELEDLKPDQSGVYHLVWIGHDKVFNMILRYSVHNGWANYTPCLMTGQMIDTREAMKNAVGVKRIHGDIC